MAEGRLIIEIYEYSERSPVPTFEFIPCSLDVRSKSGKASLKDILKAGFEGLSKTARDNEKYQESLRKLSDAGFDRICISYRKATNNAEPYVELTNVIQMTALDANATLAKKMNNIILYGKYRLSDGTETTKIRDAQRLSLIYSPLEAEECDNETVNDMEEIENGNTKEQKEVCLNITFLQQ